MTRNVHPVHAPMLAVVALAPDDDADWAGLVGDVGKVLGLEPATEVLLDGAARGRTVERLLIRAARTGGPVLVLPATARGRRSAPAVAAHQPRADGGLASMHRVLIASDASDEVAAGARSLLATLADAGVHATILHVLTAENRPRMWEGSGHHAAVWLDEVRRRHGATADVMRVVTGEPGDELRAHSACADLVVLLWRGELAPGRAAMVRSVLGSGIEIPHLLVPLEWVVTPGPVPGPERRRRGGDR